VGVGWGGGGGPPPHDGASFRVLDCGDCDIGDTAASALADLIILNDNLQRVYLPNNRIRTEGATALAGALIARPGARLKTVDLSFNPLIGNGGACALAAALRTTAPEELRISHCGVCDEGAVALGKQLKRKDSLKKLHLDGNALRAETQLLLAKLATEADVTLTLFS
jgi:Ran GTPase-activating protein (RanGAP) involved in mRNA processing and transport